MYDRAKLNNCHFYLLTWLIFGLNTLCSYFLINAVCEITFETWDDILSGHDKVCMDIRDIILYYHK